MEKIEKGYYKLKRPMGCCYGHSKEKPVDPMEHPFNIFLLKEDTIIYLVGYNADFNEWQAQLGGRPITMYAGTDLQSEVFQPIEGQEEIVEILYDNKK